MDEAEAEAEAEKLMVGSVAYSRDKRRKREKKPD